MTDDVLASFVTAFRAEHSADSLDRRALRERVIAAAGRRRVRRTERLRLLLSFAATFAGSVALAASPPVREHVRDALSFVRGGVSHPTDPGARRPQNRAPRRPLEPPAPFAADLPVPSAVVEPGAPVGVVSVAQLPLEPEAATTASPQVEPSPPRAGVPLLHASPGLPVESVDSSDAPAATGLPGADLALYRRAHELHFGGGDRALALGAWDAYLKAFPRGAFAPEARLNRAVCLAKLGHKAEAEDVLVDIERGRFGAEGRRQARKILGALAGD
jgi:hypothetical protein